MTAVPNCVITAQDYCALATARGADRAWVEEDHDNRVVEVHVSGMDTQSRKRLLDTIKKHKSLTVAVEIVPEDDTPVMLEKETVQVMAAVEQTDDDSLSVDFRQLQPLLDKYGGVKPLTEAFVNSTTATYDDVEGENDSDPTGVEPQSSPTDGDGYDGAVCSVEEIQQAYVEGEITLLEMEERLENAIELDESSYTPQPSCT